MNGMKRLVRAASIVAAAYPSLRALADVTPPPAGHGLAGTIVAARTAEEPKPQDPAPAPAPSPNPAPKNPIPILRGKVACPRKEIEKPKPAKPPAEYPRPKGDIARAARPSPQLVILLDGEAGEGMVIHPHGPDEPCSPIGRRS